MKRPKEGTLTRQIWDWLDANPGASKEALQGAFPERPWGTLSTQSSRWRKSVMAQGRAPQRQGRMVPASPSANDIDPDDITKELMALADGKDALARWHIYIDNLEYQFTEYSLFSLFFKTREKFAAAINLLLSKSVEFEVCIFHGEDCLTYSTHNEITKMLENENC